MQTSINIGIAEDQTALRKRLIEHFQYFSEITVTIASESGDALLERLPTLPESRFPHIILMDIEMPGSNGIETTHRVKERYPDTDIIMFTVFEDDDRIFDAIQAGASGYLLKDEPVDVIVAAFRELREGGAPMSASVARRMLGILRKAQVDRDAAQRTELPFNLSAREVEIIQQIVQGKTNAEIGEAMFLSPFTIKTHIKNIYRKMHVNSRAEAASLAYKRSLV